MMNNQNALIGNITTKIVLAIGILAMSIGAQFVLAKVTKITLVISPTHCYFGSAQEIPSTGGENNGY